MVCASCVLVTVGDIVVTLNCDEWKCSLAPILQDFVSSSVMCGYACAKCSGLEIQPDVLCNLMRKYINKTCGVLNCDVQMCTPILDTRPHLWCRP